jgi:hypothetical protein
LKAFAVKEKLTEDTCTLFWIYIVVWSLLAWGDPGGSMRYMPLIYHISLNNWVVSL